MRARDGDGGADALRIDVLNELHVHAHSISHILSYTFSTIHSLTHILSHTFSFTHLVSILSLSSFTLTHPTFSTLIFTHLHSFTHPHMHAHTHALTHPRTHAPTYSYSHEHIWYSSTGSSRLFSGRTHLRRPQKEIHGLVFLSPVAFSCELFLLL